MDGYPLKVYDEHGPSEFVEPDRERPKLVYAIDGDRRHRYITTPWRLEKDSLPDGRPEPETTVIQQGKYECYPAAVANMIGEKLFHVKRAFGAAGWRNDERGADDDMAVAALNKLGLYAGIVTNSTLKAFGEDAHKILNDTTKCCLFRPSLNIEGKSHAIAYNGKQMIDPNWGYAGRRWWGTEWKPSTIGANRFLILVEDAEDQRVLKDLEAEVRKIVVEDILRKLNRPIEF